MVLKVKWELDLQREVGGSYLKKFFILFLKFFFFVLSNTVFFVFLFFLALPHGTWDLSSLTRGGTHAPCIRSMES